MTTVDELRHALLAEVHSLYCEASAVRVRAMSPQQMAHQVEGLVADRLDALIAAAEARGRAGLAEALEALVEAIVTAPLIEVEDETTITLCVPLAAIKPAYWAACEVIGHQPTDPGPYCARCGATLTAVVQSAEHHPGDCAAVEEAGPSPARGVSAILAALATPPAPEPVGAYHPDPDIDSEIRQDAIAAEQADLAAGYPPRWWVCPSCGSSHARGWFLSIGQHRCLRCGYVGEGGTIHTNLPAPEAERGCGQPGCSGGTGPAGCTCSEPDL